MKQEFVQEMEEVIDNLGCYAYEVPALELIEETRFDKKANLRELFSKHPNWIEDKEMIIFETEVERKINPRAIWNAVADFSFTKFLAVESEEAKQRRQEDFCAAVPSTVESFLSMSANYAIETINENYKEYVESNFSWIEHPFRFQVGMKTSKAFNKVMTYFGYNKSEDYNKIYARFSDALSPKKIKRLTVISLNPLDFLLMSNGNSWHSCHTIDKNNYNGEYSSGTISYMLDDVSFVYYQVDKDADTDKVELLPKIIRQMFHYKNGCLAQGRLYPQGNDSEGSSVYVSHRETVQKVICDCLGIEDRLWKVEFNSDFRREYLNNKGTHYPDYLYTNGSCNYSWLFRRTEPQSFTIGAKPISIKTGREHDRESNIEGEAVLHCANCGCEIEEDDALYVNGEYYCDSCTRYCDDCGEYHLREDGEYLERYGNWVCNICLDNNYAYCEDCDEMVHIDDITRDAHGNRHCDQCIEDGTAEVTYVESEADYYPDNEVYYCEACDEYHLLSDDEEFYDENGNRICREAAERRGLIDERAS